MNLINPKKIESVCISIVVFRRDNFSNPNKASGMTSTPKLVASASTPCIRKSNVLKHASCPHGTTFKSSCLCNLKLVDFLQQDGCRQSAESKLWHDLRSCTPKPSANKFAGHHACAPQKFLSAPCSQLGESMCSRG